MADLYCGGLATPNLITVNEVDDCTGAHLTGGAYAYVFDGVRSVEYEPVLNEGAEASFVDNEGNVVCEAEDDDALLGFDLTFEKCNFPLELYALLTGQPTVTNLGGDTIGVYHDDSQKLPRMAVRIWSRTLGCAAGVRWGVLVFPFAKFTFPTPAIEGDRIQFQTVTAEARRSQLNNYGDGVFGDDLELGWSGLGDGVRGSFGFYYTDDDPQVADCALVNIP